MVVRLGLDGSSLEEERDKSIGNSQSGGGWQLPAVAGL